jgi:hypothetical protein
MGYFTEQSLAEAGGVPGSGSFNPNPGLGFSVADIFGGALGSQITKILGGGNSAPDQSAQVATLLAQNTQAQAQASQTETVVLAGVGLLIAAAIAYAATRGK